MKKYLGVKMIGGKWERKMAIDEIGEENWKTTHVWDCLFAIQILTIS